MFSFTDGDSFDDNLKKFLEYAKTIDSSHGQILSDLASTISTSDDVNERSRMRSTFNAAVVEYLDDEVVTENTGVDV